MCPIELAENEHTHCGQKLYIRQISPEDRLMSLDSRTSLKAPRDEARKQR